MLKMQKICQYNIAHGSYLCYITDLSMTTNIFGQIKCNILILTKRKNSFMIQSDKFDDI